MLEARLRPRSSTEIVDATFALIRPHYGALVSLALVGTLLGLPVYLGHVVAGPEALPFGIPNFLGTLYTFVVGSVVFASLIIAAADAYHGRAIEPAAALRVALRYAVPVALVTLALWAAVGLGLLLLIVPGLYLLARNGAAPMAVVLEPKGARAAFKRSTQLTVGSGRKVLAVYVLAYLPVLLVSWGAMGVLLALGTPLGWVEVGTALAGALLTPFVAGALAILYYDLRIIREGYDLEYLAAEAPETPRAAAASGAT